MFKKGKVLLVITLLIISTTIIISNAQEPSIAHEFRFPLEGYWSPLWQDFGKWNNQWNGYHLGEDIGREDADIKNYAVYPMADGVVKFADIVMGYTVIIEHKLSNDDSDGDYVCSVYYHMKRPEEGGIKLTVGESVSIDSPIGYVSGKLEDYKSSPHLHFGIRKGRYKTGKDPRTGFWYYTGYTTIKKNGKVQKDPNDPTHKQILADWLNPTADKPGFIESHIIRKKQALAVSEDTQVITATIYFPDDYSTIQAAVDASNPGGTIIIRDGTYIENVEIDKNLTIKSENGAEKTLVQAANSEYHVFDVITDYVNINGFTISGADALGKVGIFLDNVEYCIISNNIISENSRGIHLNHSNNNTITKNNVKTSYFDGILLAKNSNNNTITKNNVNFNDSKGALTLTRGICLADSNGNSIYLNNFTKNGNNIYYLDFEFEKTCIWDSTSKITYTYKGNTYTNNLGNYWDDYTGTDADGDGIGDTPYIIRNRNKDRRPLMRPFENYIECNFGDGNTGTDDKSTIDSTKKTITATETPNSDNFFTLEFLVDSLQNKKRGVTSKEEKISVGKNEVESLSAEMIEINLYFSDSQAMYLVPERRKILKTSTLAKHIVNELIKGPASPDLYPTIPQGTQVNEVYIAGDIVYIDLSEEVFKNHPGGSSGQLMTVYSIVNTLTEIPPIRGVQILVEGNEKKSLVGHLDISRPLLRDEDWIKP